MPILATIAVKPWLRLALLALLAYAGFCIFLYFAQRRLIYFPSRPDAPLPAGFEQWTSPAGEHWGFKRTGGASECLFFFHGNGGNASGWSHAVTEFPGDIYVLEYPGYGQRPGVPSERALKAAAREAFVTHHSNYQKVVVCGQSLGTAVTQAIFSEFADRIHTLVLVTPLLGVAQIAREQFPWVPTRWILRDTLHLFDEWQKFKGRTRIVIAGRDEVVPRSHSLRYRQATNDHITLLELPQATHNTVTLDRSLWLEILSP